MKSGGQVLPLYDKCQQLNDALAPTFHMLGIVISSLKIGLLEIITLKIGLSLFFYLRVLGYS